MDSNFSLLLKGSRVFLDVYDVGCMLFRYSSTVGALLKQVSYKYNHSVLHDNSLKTILCGFCVILSPYCCLVDH